MDLKAMGLGMNQAKRYWKWLLHRHFTDVQQEVALAVIQYPITRGLQEFNLAVNRNLYSLARAYGYRKRHLKEGKDEYGNQWELCEFQLRGGDEEKKDRPQRI
jgi:hypothetical protein